MPTYASVSWQDGDEVTSAKLNQMAQNEQYLKDNIIIGNTTINDTTNQALKIEGIRLDFDSQSAVQVYNFRVNLPPVFTEPPVIVFSHNVLLYFTVVHLTESNRTDYCEFYMAENLQNIVRFQGTMNIIAIGK
jgi:hypothetical protein